MGRWLGWALGLFLIGTSPVFAETVVLEAVLRGSTFGVSPDAAYAVGVGPSFENLFVFDLSAVTDPIVAATLVVVNPPGGFASPQRRETYALYAVTDVETYQDAGVGALVGAIGVDESSPAALQIPLAEPILRVLERTDGVVALGGRLTTLKNFDGSEHLFVGTGPGSGVPAPQLVLTTDPGAPPAPAAVLHVDAEADEDAGVGSASAPFASIAVALDLAAPGDVVRAAPGLYAERVLLKADVALRGSGAEDTILDTAELGAGSVVECTDGALVDGFRIRGLVRCARATEISNNTIEAIDTPALELRGSGAWIHHNEIHGTIDIATVDATVEDNRIESPGTAIFAGPAVAADGAALIRRNRILGELSSPSLSPLVCALWGAPLRLTLASNVFLPPAGADTEGNGGVELGGCVSADVLHNTFHETNGIRLESTATIANNVLVNGTAGIFVEDGATAEIRGNDVFGNRAGIIGPPTNYVGVPDQTGSNGNVSVDPDFVDAFFEDFRLRAGSPALEAGSNANVAGSEDFDGDPRVADGDEDGDAVIDMGAQEFQPDEELPLPALPMVIDVLPGRSANELKFSKVSKGSGKVAVAILSDDELDAPAEVDVGTLILEREPVLGCKSKDVNRDGRRDLTCSFPLRGISLGKWPIAVPPACVRGTTLAGRKLLGCDEVEILP